MATLAVTIKEATRKHLENDGFLLSQNVRGASWLLGTCPQVEEGIVELPTSDSSNSAIVTGYALAGKRPIYVVRFQGFMWYNLATIVNYAAKSKEMWDVPCPVFVRAMSAEDKIGPVASCSYHALACKMPGMIVTAPMTSQEWLQSWNFFLENTDPVYCSESRISYNMDTTLPDIITDHEVTIFAISTARLTATEAAKQLGCSIFGITWLKPLKIEKQAIEKLKSSKFGVVVDCEHTTCGVSESIALELMQKTNVPVYALGLEDRTAGFSRDNRTPSTERILQEIDRCRAICL